MKFRVAIVGLAAAFVSSYPLPHPGNKTLTIIPKLIEFVAPSVTTVCSSDCRRFCGRVAFANNDLGEIVGFCTDENVSFDAPGVGAGQCVFSINSLRAVTGQFVDASDVAQGFSRSDGGAFHTFNAKALSHLLTKRRDIGENGCPSPNSKLDRSVAHERQNL